MFAPPFGVSGSGFSTLGAPFGYGCPMRGRWGLLRRVVCSVVAGIALGGVAGYTPSGMLEIGNLKFRFCAWLS